MNTDFQVIAAPIKDFSYLFALSDQELKSIDAKRVTATKWPGFPCRVSLQDAQPGEKVILVNYAHHVVNSPYKSTGPIFVREAAAEAKLQKNELPIMLFHRQMSVRAYNAKGMMLNAKVVDGELLETCIRELFGNEKIAYLHVHNASPGCFNCLIERASESVNR
ncbi:MAG: DUF1203 domain-containing protein [Calditrichia bacterium]